MGKTNSLPALCFFGNASGKVEQPSDFVFGHVGLQEGGGKGQ
nr:MAG TPA: hypothetical protein [Caudoviricetes sp.]